MTPARELRYLLQSRHALLWVVSSEERRVEREIAAAVTQGGTPYRPVFWDCATGAHDLNGTEVGELAGNPGMVLDAIRACQERSLWVLRDLPAWLDESRDPVTPRTLKSLARDLEDRTDLGSLQVVVVLSSTPDVPATLRESVTVLDWPLPTREQIADMVDEVIRSSGKEPVAAEERQRIVDAAAGLGSHDIENACVLSLAKHGKIDPPEVAAAKKQIISRGKLLEWYDHDPRGMDGIGGLEHLKTWLGERKLAMTPEARAYGLPSPKGLLLVGPPGTGKSLTAKCVAAGFEMPLLRMDLGALKGGLVGQSEANIRQALKTAEAIQRCVLWIDEIEKALAGAAHSLDSGVSADQLGTLLTWLQEHTLPIFCIATCNQPRALRPELVSRFDDTFFVDLPTTEERAAILAKELELVGRDPWAKIPADIRRAPGARHLAAFDLDAIARATAGFSGRELAKLVKAALFAAFADSRREPATEDLLEQARCFVPVSKSAAEEIETLRAWAKQRARPASPPESTTPKPGAGVGRRLDLPALAGEGAA